MREHDSSARREDDADDLKAVHETLSGKPEAFGRIVDRYTPVIYSLADRYLGDSEDAEDATQEIFVRAYESLRRFRLGNRFYPWIYTIAINHLRSAGTRVARRLSRNSIPFDEARSRGAKPGSQSTRAPLCEPERDLERKESRAAVTVALQRLPDKYRDVLILRHFEDLSIADVAKILDIPEGTVKTHLHRARKALAAEISGVNE